MIAELVAEGFRVVDRRWVTSWLQPGPSIREASQRFAELARWIQEDGLRVRLNLQLHKYIWGADTKGV